MKSISRGRCLIILSLTILSTTILNAQWSRDPKVNTLVSGAARNQTAPRIISDGSSGAIIVWPDTRDTSATGTDIYAQRLSASGIAQWTANGVAIAKYGGDQTSPAIAADGRGGAFIVWQDNRKGNTDIYLQHIDGTGTTLLTGNGIPVCNDLSEQTHPVIVSDNLMGAIIVWEDYRNGNADIYAQHVDAAGNMNWTANGVSVVTAANNQTLPAIVSDNNGGAIIVWQDLRNSAYFDIYAQRISNTGLILWGAGGIAVSTAAGYQQNVSLASDGGTGAYLIWEDNRSDNTNVYAQHIHGDQSMGLPLNGLQVYSAANDQTQPRIVSDGSGGVIFSWVDRRNGQPDIYADRISAGDTMVWPSGGIAVCSAAGNQQNPRILSDGSGGAIIAWEDYRGGLPDIYAQRIASNGSLRWQGDGVAICTEATSQTVPVLVENSVHGAIIAWQDARKFSTQGFDIYAQLVNDIGTIGGYAIHGTLYSDLNQNGISDSGEAGLSGWKINLTGVMTKSLTTDASGNYSFDGLTPGMYTVKPEIKPGWIQTHYTDTIVSLPIGGDSVRIFPVFQLATIRGTAYNDRNHNGQYDGGEWGDSGRVIQVTGAASLTTTADKNGAFTFIGLQQGTYYVNEAGQTGYLPTSLPLVDTVVIDTPGEDISNIIFGSYRLGKITGKAFIDSVGDSSAYISRAHSGLQGWEVILTKGGTLIADTLTGSSGDYAFSNLDTGQYAIRETYQSGWYQMYPRTPADTMFADSVRGYRVTIDTSGTITASRDFGYFLGGTITAQEFRDITKDSLIAGDPGMQGWRVKLFKNGHPVSSGLTDGAGACQFTILPPGNYTVEESLFTDWRETVPRRDSVNQASILYGDSAGPRAFKVAMRSGKNLTLTFGNFQLGVISGHLLLDIAKDSIIIGDPPIPHWRIRLRGPVKLDTLTDGSGNYTFAHLDLGAYVVVATLVPWSSPTYPRVTFPGVFVDSGRRAYSIAIDSSGEQNMGKDFGISTTLITGTTFNDANGDGYKGFGDSGMAGVVVRLSGKKVDSTLSDPHGNYIFAGLDTGIYWINQDVPAGWRQTLPAFQGVYKDTLTTYASYKPGRDFGNFNMGSIAGSVYYDRDSNGIISAGDIGLADKKVYLTGPRKDSTLTDSHGQYGFYGLPLGIYVVKEARLPGWIQTVPHDSVILTIASGSNSQNIDFGNTGNGRISGSVYLDTNSSGTAAGKPRLADWWVYLQGPYATDSLKTDSSVYLFTKLVPGTYLVSEKAKPGWRRTAPGAGGTYQVSLTSGGNITARDFGNFPFSQISGMVFSDGNGNGVFDGGEPGIPGVKIFITGSRNDSLLTGSDGTFTFTNLDTGRFTIREAVQPFVVRTLPKATDVYDDSVVSSGQIHAPKYFGNFTTTNITGSVFNDLVGNGIKDPGDPPLQGWNIHLQRVDGILAADSLVKSSDNGTFQFTGISPGVYVITEERPLGWSQTTPVQPDTVVVSAPGQQIINNNLGNYYYLFSGTVYDDYDGDGQQSSGEPGRPGVRLYLKKNGIVVDSTTSLNQGLYAFAGRGYGTYLITQLLPPGYIETGAPSSFTINQPSGGAVGNLNFGSFKLFSVAGVVYEDVNRNGVRDAGEGGLVQCVIALMKNSQLIATGTSLADGSYTFGSLGPGNYSLTQYIRTGYLKSYPVAPDSFAFTGQSGVAVAGKNFGNYLSPTRSITVRTFTDLDGSPVTRNDLTPKNWSMSLFRGSTLLKATVGASLDTTNLPEGRYTVQIADSTGGGWQSLGERHIIHRSGLSDSIITLSSPVFTDSFDLHTGESHLVDFLSTKYARIVIRTYGDADGSAATLADEEGLVRNTELYINFVSPENLVYSGTDSLLMKTDLGGGIYIVRQIPPANWKTIGRRINGRFRSTADDTVQIVINGGDADTVDFMSSLTGSIVVRNMRDDDGNIATATDRNYTPWNVAIYKDVISPLARIDSVDAESLTVHPFAGNYIIQQARGPQWKTIGTFLDGISIGARDTVHITINGADSHTVDFLNAASGRTKIWTGTADACWGNHLNWSPQVLPTGGDSIIISADHAWRVPQMPGYSGCTALAVNPNAAVEMPLTDSVEMAQGILVNGSVIVDPSGTPVITLDGDLIGTGSFTTGKSTVIVKTSQPRSVLGGTYYNLQIGPPTSRGSAQKNLSTSSNNILTGNTQINNVLTLNDNISLGKGTLTIASDDPAAMGGAGAIPDGSILRPIRNAAVQEYRFQYDSTYIQFSAGGGTPQQVLMKYLDTSLVGFGTTWDSISADIDTTQHTIAVTNVTSLTRDLPFAFGAQVGGRWAPLLHHFYVVQAVPETGFVAKIKFVYMPSDLQPGVPEGSLVLLKLRLVRKDIADSVFAGWNLVSVPVFYSDNHKSAIYPLPPSDMYGYQPGAGYWAADLLTGGTGYWMKFLSDEKFLYSGIERAVDSLDLEPGWDLFGTISYPVKADHVTSSIAGNILSSFFGYNGGYYKADTLWPGRAYWVKLGSAGKITLDHFASGVEKRGEEALPADLNALRIRDAAGHIGELYFGSSTSVHQAYFELPPVPPEGVFDIRYGSARNVEIYPVKDDASREYLIHIQGAVYPVTLEWRLRDPVKRNLALELGSGGVNGRVVLDKDGTVRIENSEVREILLICEKVKPVPTAFALRQCYPNPFNPTTRIDFDLPVASEVTVKIYDLLGREVATLSERALYEAGTQSVVFNASDCATGVYFYRMEAVRVGNPDKVFTDIKKMLFVK